MNHAGWAINLGDSPEQRANSFIFLFCKNRPLANSPVWLPAQRDESSVFQSGSDVSKLFELWRAAAV